MVVRNDFQTDTPAARINAVRKVVHENAMPKEACEAYQAMKAEKK